MTDELLNNTLTLNVDQQLELALQSVAPTIRAIHILAKEQRMLEPETMDLLSKAVGILLRIRSKHDPDNDLTNVPTKTLKKMASGK